MTGISKMVMAHPFAKSSSSIVLFRPNQNKQPFPSGARKMGGIVLKTDRHLEQPAIHAPGGFVVGLSGPSLPIAGRLGETLGFGAFGGLVDMGHVDPVNCLPTLEFYAKNRQNSVEIFLGYVRDPIAIAAHAIVKRNKPRQHTLKRAKVRSRIMSEPPPDTSRD